METLAPTNTFDPVQALVPWSESDIEMRLIIAILAICVRAETQDGLSGDGVERAVSYVLARIKDAPSGVTP